MFHSMILAIAATFAIAAAPISAPKTTSTDCCKKACCTVCQLCCGSNCAGCSCCGN